MTSFEHVLSRVRDAGRTLANLSDGQVTSALLDFSKSILSAEKDILAANTEDLGKIDFYNPLRSRLELTQEKIQSIARDVQTVASLPSPLHKILESRTLSNGIELSRVTVPLGVVGAIYEARPNVTADIFSLCLKSGNACVLKGGIDAAASSSVIVDISKRVLERHAIDTNAVHLITGGRTQAQEMMDATDFIDVIIPRGGKELITYVRQNAHVPVIETGAGVVHIFLDETADPLSAARIIYNSKTSRPAACNALDTLIVHEKKASSLNDYVKSLADAGVKIFADEKSYAVLAKAYPVALLHKATQEHFGVEFLSLAMSVKTVAGLKEAIDHISTHSSKHTEVILSQDQGSIENFLRDIDAAVVAANISSVFTDGGQFGLGAEVGISTQKLHARGPMGLEALTTYKWILRGEGQIRIV